MSNSPQIEETRTIESLGHEIESLRREFRAYASGRQQIFEDVEELFCEFAKAMDVVAVSLESLSPPEEQLDHMDETGVMGRAFELQALVGIFRNNLDDLRRRVAAMR